VPNSIIVYTLRAEFNDPSVRERYLAWLRSGHCAAVVREGGALSGEVSVLDDGVVESRYLFGSRADFAAYEAGPAIALRAEGIRLFPPEQGVRFGRSLGVREIRVPD
jgi:hypothetical protein